MRARVRASEERSGGEAKDEEVSAGMAEGTRRTRDEGPSGCAYGRSGTSAARDFARIFSLARLAFTPSRLSHRLPTATESTVDRHSLRPFTIGPPPPARNILRRLGDSPPSSPPGPSSPTSSSCCCTTPRLELVLPESPIDPQMAPGFLSPFKSKQRERAPSFSSAHSAESRSPSLSSQAGTSTPPLKQKPSFLILPPRVRFADSSSSASFGTSTQSSYASSGPPTPNDVGPPSPQATQVPVQRQEQLAGAGRSAEGGSGLITLEARRRAQKEEKRRKAKDPVYQGLKSLGL